MEDVLCPSRLKLYGHLEAGRDQEGIALFLVFLGIGGADIADQMADSRAGRIMAGKAPLGDNAGQVGQAHADGGEILVIEAARDLDGLESEHDQAVDKKGVFKLATKAIATARDAGFRVNINCTLFEGVDTERIAKFFDHMMELDVEGITVSPGFSYERAPDQDHFLNRERTRQLFRDIFRHNRNGKWRFSHSSLFLDFLAGNQTYHCTPWGNPTRNVFGWQRPCYLLGEGYVGSFKELMEETDWQSYGTGNYEKCADCMAHCGYEATAVTDMVTKPWKAVALALRGVRTEGPMAPDVSLENARPAEYVFAEQVESAMKEDVASKLPDSGERKATVCDAA